MSPTADADAPHGPDPELWIDIPNWDDFQQYRKRDPIFIKVYTKLLHNPHFLALSSASQGALLVIWLAYARQNGQISVRNVIDISRKRITNFQLRSLNHAGFISFVASKPLAIRARSREKEEEIDPLTPTTRKTIAERRALDVALEANSSEDFANRIEEIERDLSIQLPVSVRERLWDEAFKRLSGGTP